MNEYMYASGDTDIFYRAERRRREARRQACTCPEVYTSRRSFLGPAGRRPAQGLVWGKFPKNTAFFCTHPTPIGAKHGERNLFTAILTTMMAHGPGPQWSNCSGFSQGGNVTPTRECPNLRRQICLLPRIWNWWHILGTKSTNNLDKQFKQTKSIPVTFVKTSQSL